MSTVQRLGAILLRHDKAKRFRFASIQGANGKQLLRDAGLQLDRLENSITQVAVGESGAIHLQSPSWGGTQ